MLWLRGGVALVKVITFKVDEELLQQIDQYAHRENVTRSEFIRRALAEYIVAKERKRYGEPRIIVIG